MKRQVQKAKSGQEVAKQKNQASAIKVHVDYWSKRIFRPTYTRNGERREVPTYSARIQHAGRREVSPCNTPNAANAAETARGIYILLVTYGWEETIGKFKPKGVVKPADIATVGALIGTAEKVSVANPRSH